MDSHRIGLGGYEKEKRAGKYGRIAPAKGESDDQEYGRQCWAFALNHEAHSMERRSTDPEE